MVADVFPRQESQALLNKAKADLKTAPFAQRSYKELSDLFVDLFVQNDVALWV